MSTEANAALAWPIEITEFAYIGDEVAHDLDQPDLFESCLRDVHYGTHLWRAGDDAPPLELCGTSIPGDIRFAYEPEVAAALYVHRNRPEAGMFWSEAAMAWRVRPFIGSPESDPTIHEEGTRSGYWEIAAEGHVILDVPYTDAEVRTLKSRPVVPHAWVCGADAVTGLPVCVCGQEEEHRG